MANWSLPKYDCPAPAATMRWSYLSTVVLASFSATTTREVRLMLVTSLSSTVAFSCLARMSRVAGEISPVDRIPVATW